MGSLPILSVKQSVSIDTMTNFDGDGDGDGACKQALTVKDIILLLTRTFNRNK